MLVTGASGFIGSHLVKKLKKTGRKVVLFDRKTNGLNPCILGDIVNFDFGPLLHDVEVVFHLAGLLGTTELFHRILEAERTNVLGTLNLLEAMRRRNVDKIVFTSKPNVWRHNVYTITKENCERFLEMYREIYGFKTIITRPYNVYGPGEQVTDYRKAIPYFIISALRNEPIEIFGSGNQTVDAIYVDDAVEALLLCEKKEPGEHVEIGTGHPIKVRDLAQKIIGLTGSSSRIVYLPMRRGEESNSNIKANGNMPQLIGYRPKTCLEEGLRNTIHWYHRRLSQFKKIYSFSENDFIR